MSIAKAISFIVKSSQNTDQSAISLVRKFWSKLSLSDFEVESLAQQALANRVSQVLVGKARPEPVEIPSRSADSWGSYSPAPKEQSETIEFDAVVTKTPIKTIDVSVRILYETGYDIRGKRKSFVEFTIYDLNYSISRYQQQIDGHTRHLQVMEYTKERLTKLGKKSVSELAPGEQSILARKLKAAINRNAEAA